MSEYPGYTEAMCALELQAALSGVEIEKVEAFVCEDDDTVSLRAWLTDGRDLTASYLMSAQRSAAAGPGERAASSETH